MNNLRFGSGDLFIIKDWVKKEIWEVKNLEIHSDKSISEILWDNTIYYKKETKSITIGWDLYNFDLNILNEIEGEKLESEEILIESWSNDVSFNWIKILNKWNNENLIFEWNKCFFESGFSTKFNEKWEEIYIPIKIKCIKDNNWKIFEIKKELLS